MFECFLLVMFCFVCTYNGHAGHGRHADGFLNLFLDGHLAAELAEAFEVRFAAVVGLDTFQFGALLDLSKNFLFFCIFDFCG